MVCLVSDFILKEKVKNYSDIEFWFKVNGIIKQKSSISDMIFSVLYVISYISSYIILEEGDVIIIGFLVGVGLVELGEIIEVGFVDIMNIEFFVIVY